MATSEWRIWSGIENETDVDADVIGTTVGTAVSANYSPALFFYLDKAGIKVDPVPTSGQGWPR